MSEAETREAAIEALDALPVGLQLAGPAFGETDLLDAAFALEAALEFPGSPPR